MSSCQVFTCIPIPVWTLSTAASAASSLEPAQAVSNNGCQLASTAMIRNQMAALGTLANLQFVLHSLHGMGTAIFAALKRFLGGQMLPRSCGALLIAGGFLCLPENLIGAATVAGPGPKEQETP